MASVEELIVKLTADNSDLKKKLGESEKQVGGFGGALKGIGAIAVAGFAVAGVAALAFGQKAYASWEVQAQANRRLLAAVKGNTQAFAELETQAGKLQQSLGIDDDAIMQIQMLAAASGKSTDQIKKLTEAATYLSKATGQDLQAAYLQINTTLTGSAGRLARLDAEFGTLSKTQLQNGDAIDLVITKYKDLAIASTTSADKLTQNWGEFQESFGKVVAPSVNYFLESMNTNLRLLMDDTMSFGEKMRWAFSTSQPDAYNKSIKTVGETATEYYRTILGVNAALAGTNELFRIGDKQGPVITPNNTKEIKNAKSALDLYIDSMEEMYSKAQAIAAFDVPAMPVSQKVNVIFGTAQKPKSQLPESGGINAPSDNQDALRKAFALEQQFTESLKGEYQKRKEELKKQLDEGLINQQEYDSKLKKINQEQTQSTIANLSMMFGMAQSMFEENTLAYKTIAVAQGMMNTYLAATAAYAAGLATGGPAGLILGPIMAGVAVSAGLANVAKIAGAFAQGGIVGGGSYSGDNMTARVNSGEMILNGRQQSELFAMANGMGGRQQIEVVGYISGDVIRLTNKRSEYMANKRG